MPPRIFLDPTFLRKKAGARFHVKRFTGGLRASGYLLIMPSAFNSAMARGMNPVIYRRQDMTLRLSLLSAVAVAALFAQNTAQAENRNFGSCDGTGLKQIQCALNAEGGFGSSRGLRENDNDHRGDKGDPKGGDNNGRGNDGGNGNGGGAGGNDGGNEGGGGGEGGEGGS